MNPQVLPHVQASPMIWAAFLALVLVVLAIDNMLVDKKAHKVSVKEALFWSAVWVGISLLFALWLWKWEKGGTAVASSFLTGYILEKALSVDNIFVFLIIFSHYKVPQEYHHKVLSWGVYGAMIMRAIFIGLGSAAVARWHWILYVFGAFLLYTGVKLMVQKDGEEVDPKDSPIFKLAHRLFNVTKKYQGNSFFVRIKGKLWATPLFVIVLVVEATDLIFAVDSIPAVFGITTDPFIVYTSNIFAILGLRAMFFALEGVLHMFRFLKAGLSLILVLIGLKLLFLHWAEARFQFDAGEMLVLGTIGAILLISVAASVLIPVRRPALPPRGGRGRRR